MRQALPQGIRNIKTFTKYKNCYCWGLTNLSSQKKKTQEAVTAVMDGNGTWHYDKTY